MRIAIYYPWLYLTSGVERVIVEMVKRSKHDYTIFTNHWDKYNTYPEYQHLDVVELNRVDVRRDMLSVLKAAITISMQKIDLARYDLLMVHSDGLGDLILLKNTDTPAVCYCHTPLRPVFDNQYRKRALEERSLLGKIIFFTFSWIFKIVDGVLWNNYKYVFFNSNETKKRAIVGRLVKDNNKVAVLHPGVDCSKHKPSWEYEKYFLLPGRIMWTKNIELAINAFSKLRRDTKKFNSFKLVIAGQVDKKSKRYLSYLRKLAGKTRNVEFVISPTEEELMKLYSNCWSVLLTSFNEDWGLTALEGNAYGKPVVATNKGGPVESQIDNETGYLVQDDVNDLSKAMKRLAGSIELTKSMGKKARINVNKYSWKVFIEIFERTISGLSIE